MDIRGWQQALQVTLVQVNCGQTDSRRMQFKALT